MFTKRIAKSFSCTLRLWRFASLIASLILGSLSSTQVLAVYGDIRSIAQGGWKISTSSIPDGDTTLEEALPGTDTNWWAAAQDNIRHSEYHITWQERTLLADAAAAYQAPNRAQNLRMYFTPTDVRVLPRTLENEAPPWEWGLTLNRYGYAGQEKVVTAATLHVQDNRIEYQREALTEWFVNDEGGLEHGFTLSAPPLPATQGHIGLQIALSGNLTPHLAEDGRAVEFATAGGVTVLSYGDLLVTDSSGRLLPASLSSSPTQIAIWIDANSAVYPITIDPLLTSPAWTAEIDQADAQFGFSVSTAGDVDGDGYSDVIIGAPYYDNGQTDEGRAYVFHGSAIGLSTTPDWSAESDQTGASFGYSVDTAGDVDGDGYADIIVGARYYDNDETDEGRAYVYTGSATGLSVDPAWTAESDQANAQFGFGVGTAGDVNGDGYSDIIVGAHAYDNIEMDEGWVFVYHGSSSGLNSSADWSAESNQTGAWFGTSVGTAGDVNGDGYADIIIGAHGYDTPQTNGGQAYVYHGAAGGLSTDPDWIANSDQANAEFGFSAGTAGDVNGDGYSDVIVGARYYDNNEVDEGGAFVYYGAAAGLDSEPAWSAEGNQANAWFGLPVGTAGDVNGDGYADIIIGAHWYNNDELDEGRAYIYHGSAIGPNTLPNWTTEGDQADAHYGFSLGTAGDVNGDGFSDVIVGARYFDNDQTDEGRAYVYHGAPEGVGATPAWSAESNQDYAYLGYAVSTAGDVNGDGYSDVIVGAPLYNNDQTDEGRIFVFHGSASGLSTTVDWITESDQDYAYFGWSVGTAGDVNGDGYSDIIVGAYRYDNDQTEEGRCFVYHGSASGLSTTPAWITESDQDYANFGRSVGTAGDVNGDGYSDVIIGAYTYDNDQINEGRAFVFHGSASGLSATVDWTAESDQDNANFGRSVSTAGDVNGDGYSDIIIGAPLYTNDQAAAGRVFVYHGSASGLGAGSAWDAESDQDDSNFGRSVGTAGDVNGDGYSDVIIGAHTYDNSQTNEGRAFVHHGSASGVKPDSSWSAEADQEDARFGWSVGTAGDVNGDGYSDVIVGAYLYDNSEADEGQAFVYHGAAEGLSASPAWTAESNHAGAYFGISVNTAGDINGDGYADVIVGAENYDDGETDEGWAFVYYGNGSDGLHLRPRQMNMDGSALIDHLGMSDSRSAFQVSLIGRMPLGREQVRLQWQASLLGTPITATTVLSGTSDWTDVLTTGIEITQTITGLAPGTLYHWRVRLLYSSGNALGQPASRWVTIPWNSWNEADLRTANQPPLADAGTDQSVDRLALVTLDGSASYDPDGDIPLSYLWRQTGGPNVSFTSNMSVTIFTAPINPAVLTFTLIITDNLGMPSEPDEVGIMVNNQLPLADAGPDRTVSTIALVSLNGSTSVDPDNDLPLSYLWQQIGGPDVTFSPNLSITSFTAPGDPSLLTFTLIVTDSLGQPSVPDEVVITVDNQAPIADAGPDQSVDTGAMITLDGSASYDPDNDLPLSYLWEQIGGPDVSFMPNLSVTTFDAPGNPALVTFILIVTDSLGLASTTDEVMVAVSNQPPVADAGLDQSTNTLAPVTLDGSLSNDPDDDLLLAYLWTQSAGPTVTLSDPTLPSPTFSAPADPAVLKFTLIVTDSLGLPSVPDEIIVTVINQPPVANAGPDQSANTLVLITLDGRQSNDPDGDLPLTYLWTQTSGPAVALNDHTLVSPSFLAPTNPSVMTFSLVVTDSLGFVSASDEVIITIQSYHIYLPLVIRY